MKLAVAIWLMALVLIFAVAAFLLSHDPWIFYVPA